jgi:hypothetical protein
VTAGREVTHAYGVRGTYTRRLRVDQDGTVCETSSTIEVRGGRAQELGSSER